MKTLTTLIILLIVIPGYAQRSIRGEVRNREGDAIAYANVFLVGSYNGTITDSTGYFKLETASKGKQSLRVSYLGYEGFELTLGPGSRDTSMRITLVEKMNQLNEVSICAGTFTASDEKQSATLSSYDITTTASAMGDLYGAYATMPGSQKVGEDGMLFVRGGEARETRTYMDGMYMQSPYLSKQPDIPTRGRYSPLLFSETIFSTGGYSAEYGQALSSVVDLTTNGLEESNKASLALMSVGGSGSFSRRWERSSLAMTGLYTNSTLHNQLFKQEIDWISDPKLGDITLMYRQKTGKEGMLKSFAALNGSSMEMNYDNFPEDRMDNLKMKDRNLLLNTTYSGPLGEEWSITGGLSANTDREDLVYRRDPIQTYKRAGQARLTTSWEPSGKIKWRTGLDALYEGYERTIYMENSYHQELNQWQGALFSEADILIARKIAIRAGLRAEYLSYGESPSLSPRLSAALKTGSFSQLSLAWGKYSQLPALETLLFAPQLQEEKAEHIILNYQWRRNRRMFRIEAYHKQYKQLVKYLTPLDTDPGNYSNQGRGYARGIDLFWRDRQSIPDLDYWISYSFLDTERDYRNYPVPATPDYASAHNLSLVAKYFISRIRTFAGLTYSFASPRAYHDPNKSAFMSGLTPCYHDLSMGLTYLTAIAGKQVVLHMNMTNVTARKNIFGYTFSNTPDSAEQYSSKPVVAPAGRQAVLVILISL